MIEVTAKQVRELRVLTGAPMMDCKTALLESKGDMDIAKDWLRTKGLVAVNVHKGKGVLPCAAIVKVNCETDFVAKNEIFQNFVSKYIKHYQNGFVPYADSGPLTDLIAKLGENVKLGDPTHVQGQVVAAYVHSQVADNLGSIGVVVALDGEPSDKLAVLAKDLAMHIAATNPRAIDETSLDQEWLDHERSIFVEQAKDSGKPEAIVEKMVDGRMKKVMRENTLVNQPFVKNAERTVGDLLCENNAKVIKFVRMSISD